MEGSPLGTVSQDEDRRGYEQWSCIAVISSEHWPSWEIGDTMETFVVDMQEV